jgi:hypothetical protein
MRRVTPARLAKCLCHQGTGHDDYIADDLLLESHERLAIALISGLGLHIVLAVLR